MPDSPQATAPTRVAPGRWVYLVPIQIFGEECDHDDHRGAPVPFGFGLMDAVPAWSDCNRALGHMFRVDDFDRTDQDVWCVRVWVPDAEMPKLLKDWRDGPGHPPNLRVVREERVIEP